MSKLKFRYYLLDDKALAPVKANPTDSGFDVFVHSFKKAWIRGSFKEEMLESDERGIIEGISIPLDGDGTPGQTPKEIRDNLKPHAVVVNPGDRVMMGTGIKAHVTGDPGKVYELQVRPRSGNATKQGLVVTNTPGTVDDPYRGEICVCITNTSGNAQRITLGDKIAQLVPAEVPMPELEQVKSPEELGETSRGEDGFGSSGK